MLVTDTSYEAAIEFMQLRDHIDCLIPRGGPSLINSILDNAKVPYVIDGDGNCHVYVDEAADLDLATNVIVNAKMQRPSVCNAAESLVVHSQIAPNFLPRITNALEGVELVGDERSRDLVPSIQPATEEDWSTEYLDLKMSVRIVDNIDEAITHINNNSTGHSEAIISSNQTATKEFARRVDAAAVLVNTSTRFVDGEEFGFGAEIGISTQKLHARGPMGLEQLTTTKYIVNGQGQTRG
jgi:glutamate-5-semialdehyde dehydrogenase